MSLSKFFILCVLQAQPMHGYEIARTVERTTRGGLLLLAWAQVETPWVFYLIWVGIGASMAGVLYEPAFAVITATFGTDARRGIPYNVAKALAPVAAAALWSATGDPSIMLWALLESALIGTVGFGIAISGNSIGHQDI